MENARKTIEEAVKKMGVSGIRNLSIEEVQKADITENMKKTTMAALKNYKLLRRFLSLMKEGKVTTELFGELLNEHHRNLRDGLGISTPEIEEILKTAMENGALGGKLNGTGGGGCCYVYAKKTDLENVKKAVEAKGYPARIITVDRGASVI